MEKLTPESKKIYETIKKYSPLRSSELGKLLKISNKNLYKHLSRLLDQDLITKSGETPKVFYTIQNESSHGFIEDSLNTDDLLVEHNYIYVAPSGELVRGLKGFETWVNKYKLNLEKEKLAFIKKLKEMNKLKKKGLISAKKTILSGNKELFLDNIFFSDFYNFDHFGKSKLGQLVYVAKASQDRDLAKEITKIILPGINYLIEKYNIGTLCYIPPTIDRKIQFLDLLKKYLSLDLNEIKADKVTGITKIPQKTLRKLEDRIINAKTTIAVNPTQQIKNNILLIDDATGSGATLNETAKKIKNFANKTIKIYGYSIVGSYKGFDVISEV